MSFLTYLLILSLTPSLPPPPTGLVAAGLSLTVREEASTSHLRRIEGGRQEERDDGGQRVGGREEGRGLKLQEARERSKNRRDLRGKRGRGGGDRAREREREDGGVSKEEE